MTRLPVLLLLILAAVLAPVPTRAASPPNVVLVITDDQGYGDLAAHGNRMIQTPHMDRLFRDSVRLTNYHVDPTCSPTRSALMTGRYSTRTGVWHTILGRSIMRPDELTLAEVFAANGYRTAQFGKWHLGDNYPCRAEDQGFHHVVRHGGGGVGQTPDYWGNDYFDDTYLHQDKWRKDEGYCTDVWFREAMRFIESNKDRPFFVYLPTNAPHGPYNVADSYARLYRDKGVPETMARFYGMITNIDENLGKLRAQLDRLDLTDNTLFIFTTDNGTAAGAGPRGKGATWNGFNAGMRGQKGSEYEGGHRVPFFLHWPNGKLTGGRDVSQLSAHIDILPTLIDLCSLKKPEGPPLDGTSLRAPLEGDAKTLRERTLFVHSQRIQHPEKWRKCAVMTERWRLVNGKELYDLPADPAQTKDRSAEHPDVVKQLRAAYDGWWDSLKPAFKEPVRLHLGNDRENPVSLTCHDWHCEDSADCPWSQVHIERGHLGNGPWTVHVEKDGTYEITLLRWPSHLDRAMDCTKARVKIGNIDETKDVRPEDSAALFRVKLASGPTELTTWLTRKDGKTHGAYFAQVRRVE